MPRKPRLPLENRGREILFYKGDWDRLAEILHPKGMKPGTFIRELVASTLRKIESRMEAKQ